MGSIMTYRLLCELSMKNTAVAHSGQMVYLPTEAPGNKVSILNLHAELVPYYGGLSVSRSASNITS